MVLSHGIVGSGVHKTTNGNIFIKSQLSNLHIYFSGQPAESWKESFLFKIKTKLWSVMLNGHYKMYRHSCSVCPDMFG